MSSRAFKAISVLLTAGFLGGFCLSSGTARYLAPSIHKQAGGEGGGGGGGGGGRGHQGAQREEGSAGQGGGAGTQGEGRGQAARTPDAGAAPGAGSAADQPLRVLLSGNTLRNEQARDTPDRYLSARGWQGLGSRAALVVHRWALKGSELCILGGGQNPPCETLAMNLEPKPAPGFGARLGTVTTSAGITFTVLRGNVAQMPEIIPLSGGPTPRNADPREGAPTATGAKAVAALVGHAVSASAAGEPAPTGYFFSDGGDWVIAHPLTPGDPSGLGGLRVAVGHWDMRAGTLCLDQPGLELARSCYLPQLWGKRAFRFVPVQSGPTVEAALLSDGA